MSRWETSVRWIAAGVAAGFVLLLAGDGRTADARVQGIDPLEVLNLRVKPNVVFLLDTSSSMAKPPDSDLHVVGADDPASRFYHVKLALRDVVAVNGDQANLGIAQFGTLDVDKKLADEKTTGGPFVYVTQDASAAALLGRFSTESTGSATAADVFNSLNNTETGFGTAYCGTGTCRYYLKSRVFRNNVAYTIALDNSVTETAIDCAPAPAGLLGDDTADVNPSEERACMVIRDAATGGTGTFYFTSAVLGAFEDATTDACQVQDPSSADSVAVPGCTAPSIVAMNEALRLEFGINDTAGADRVVGVPERFKDGEVGVDVNFNPTDDTVSGLRLSPSDSTPAFLALRHLASYYTGTVFGGIRPQALDDCPAGETSCLQRNYVVYITDGTETCETPDQAEDLAASLYANGGASRPQDSIETIVIAYTGNASVDDANDLARAGSGGVKDTATGRWSCTEAGAADTCRDAIRAATADELSDSLSRAMNLTLVTGSYSDQQSITETVYELVQFAPRSDTVNFPQPGDPDTRYDSTLPLVFQSTFDMPGFVGHLKAFRRRSFSDLAIDPAWGGSNDAGEKLTTRIKTGMTSVCGASGECTYPQLACGSTTSCSISVNSAPTESGLTGAIKRRIFTSGFGTPQNGAFAYSDSLGVQTGTNATSDAQKPYLLWPNSGTSTAVDAALGIASMTFEELQGSFGACQNISPATDADDDCASATLATRTAKAREEARQIVLAYNAGAEVSRNSDATVRRSGGRILFVARAWALAESTLAAPGVVTPPLETSPAIHQAEYALFRDGVRSGNVTSASYIPQGYGLRNPDLDETGSGKDGIDTRVDVKPMMSVVYHAANDGLHAFRAGPSCGSQLVSTCQPNGKSYVESGGEELWLYVPFDQLGKLRQRMNVQTRDEHVYMLSAPVRFGDIFVKSAAPVTVGTTSTAGKWRTVLYLGRGIAGKYLSALDVTFSGTYVTASLDTPLPGIVFNRGNPDTVDGTAGGTKINGNADFNNYATMGETWSVPVLGRPRSTQQDEGRFTTSSRSGRCPASETTCIPEFALWMGSGFGSSDAEGSSFYMMDAQTGDILRRHDVGDKAALTADGITNSIVASPAGYSQKQLTSGTKLGHPASGEVDRIYVGDVHGRLWKFLTDSTAPLMFADAGDDQPISVGAGLISFDSDTKGAKPHVYMETGYDCRLPGTLVDPGTCSDPNNAPPFKMLGFRDDDVEADPSPTDGIGGVGTLLFGRAFPALPAPGYRGTTQPATVFARDSSGSAYLARVFFAGNTFIPPGDDCLGRFESIVYILSGVLGQPAFNLPDEGGAAFKLSDQRVMGLRTVGGQLVVDRGIDADSAPPPPAPPQPEDTTPNPSTDVFTSRIRYGTTVCH